jgi:leucyl aminopeptidase
MSTLALTDGAVNSGVIVVGLSFNPNKASALTIESGTLTLDTRTLLAQLKELGATGKHDEIIKIPGTRTKLIVFTGLGQMQKEFAHETLRRAAGAAARALAGSDEATFALPTANIEAVAAIAEGAALGAYAFDEFRGSTKSERKLPLAKIAIHSKLSKKIEAKNALKRAQIIAKYTHLVRDLINTPPSHLTPDTFTKKIAAVVKSAGGASAGLKVSVLNEKQLKSGGYGGIIGVGQGSANPPRLLHITYTPKKSLRKFAFVGKGITFDTGGLALKPAAGMEAMKSDMSGAAAVCGAILAIASLKLPVSIEAWAPLAENMVSDNATRPSDVITIYGGKTVEVLNPDAEGRLILADALVKAQETKSLDGLVDVATLTGAQVVALGTRTSAVMTNNEAFSAQLLSAATDSGEAFWPMPLPQELRASLDSPVADLANIGERMGGMLVAGLFLKDFVKSEVPWLHLDIAGPAYNESGAHGYTPVGGTGVALRTLLRLVENSIIR